MSTCQSHSNYILGGQFYYRQFSREIPPKCLLCMQASTTDHARALGRLCLTFGQTPSRSGGSTINETMPALVSGNWHWFRVYEKGWMEDRVQDFKIDIISSCCADGKWPFIGLTSSPSVKPSHRRQQYILQSSATKRQAHIIRVSHRLWRAEPPFKAARGSESLSLLLSITCLRSTRSV